MDTRSDSGTPPEAPNGRPATGFFDWLRGLRIVRGDDRWFAGVAGGIAARAGIDPIIVRGLFVVLALVGGAAVLLYIAGWLLLPDRSGRIHVEEIIRGRAGTGVIVTAVIFAALAVIPVLLSFVAPVAVFNWNIWGAIGVPEWVSATAAWLSWAAIIVLALIWLRRTLVARGNERRADRGGQGTTTPDPSTGTAPQAQGESGATEADLTPAAPGGRGFASAASANDTASFESERQSEPEPRPDQGSAIGARAGYAPDPRLGAYAAPAAGYSERAESASEQSAEQAADQAASWGRRAGEKATEWAEAATQHADEWSARYAERQEATKLGSAHTIVTIALALIAAGTTAAWASGPAMTEPLVPALIAAVCVLALSLILAGIRGKRTGLVGFLAACGVVALIATALLPAGSRFQPFGHLVTSGESAGVVALAGNVSVDLREDRAPSGTPDVTAWLLAGNVTVLLPEDEPTVVDVRVLAGRVEERTPGETSRRIAGPLLASTVTSNLPGDADARELADARRITVYTLAGNVTVKHAERTLGETGTGSGAGGSSRADAAEIAAIREELDTLDWRLEEPGLTSAERAELKKQQRAAQDELGLLETGSSR